MSRPNIILVTCDQLRAFEMGCYGNRVIRTPHLDRLAAEGARVETAITNYPVCMAARSVLLSGQYNRRCTGGIANVAYPSRPGDHNMPEYPEAGRPHLRERCLPELLRDEGYHTAAIGKWHIHSWPHDIGFDEYVIPRVHHCHSGQSYTENGTSEFVPSGWSVDFEAERVERLLHERAQSSQPFFLYYNISPPHCPLADAPDSYLTMYRPEEIPLRANVDLSTPLKDQEHWFKVYRWDFRYYNLHLPYTAHLPEGYDLRHLIAEYYGLTTWVDDTVGRMLATLEADGLAEDTVVVFTSDHGDNLGSQGRVQKGSPNEESIRIPLLVRWPAGLAAQRVVHEQVASLVDVAPTLLGLLGLEAPNHLHGQDLASLLRGEAEATAQPHAIFETGQGAGLRSRSHLLFLPYQAGPGALADAPSYFWDVAADPFELRNLAGTDEQAGMAREMEGALRAWDAATPWMAMGT